MYLDPADYRALKRIAARKKRQPAELVREAVADMLCAPPAAPRSEERGRVRKRPPGSERACRRAAEGNGTRALIVADTGAILALLDKGDRHHAAVRELYEDRPDEWRLPWVILPEVDYLVGSELGARAQKAFLADLAEGALSVEYGRQITSRAHAI